MSQHSFQLLLKPVPASVPTLPFHHDFLSSFGSWVQLLLLATPAHCSPVKLGLCTSSIFFFFFFYTLFFPNRFGTHGCFDSKPDSWILPPEFATEWIQMLHSELCSSLNSKKPSVLKVFILLFHSSKNRGVMRRCMHTWREIKRIPIFTLATMFSSQCRPLTWSAPTFCTFQI